METSTRTRGALGEELACRFLVDRGYAILERNARAGRREVDILASRGELLVAVEVKWRRVRREEVDAGAWWRSAQRRRGLDVVFARWGEDAAAAQRSWRFDLIVIEERDDGWTLVHRRGAWSPRDSYW